MRKPTKVCSICLSKNILSCWKDKAFEHAPDLCKETANKVACFQTYEISNKALIFFFSFFKKR